MSRSIYFDVLDTARTKLGGPQEEERRAGENRFRGQAEIKMSLLCGWTPTFPQTYGWDSSALLDYGAEESFAGKSFFSLVRQGLIRIRLRDHKSIWDAALHAFQSPAYHSLGAWPEFNAGNPLEARRPLVEAMRNWQPRLSRIRKYSQALPEKVCHRLELLRELSDAVKQAPAEAPELQRGDRLSRLIKVAAEAAKELDPKVASLLSRCTTDVSDPNNRTAIDIFLEREKVKLGDDLIRGVREITNGCFNAVAAHCVRAQPALTLSYSTSVALKVLLRSLPGSTQSDLYEGAIGENEISELEVVGWDKIEEFLTKCDKLPINEKTREAEAAKLIAAVAIENVPRYVMMIDKKNFLYNAAIWGAVGLVSAAGGFAVAGAPGAIVGAIAVSAVANGLAGGLGSLDVKSAKKAKIAAHLEKKWLGLIPARESHFESQR